MLPFRQTGPLNELDSLGQILTLLDFSVCPALLHEASTFVSVVNISLTGQLNCLTFHSIFTLELVLEVMLQVYPAGSSAPPGRGVLPYSPAALTHTYMPNAPIFIDLLHFIFHPFPSPFASVLFIHQFSQVESPTNVSPPP
jgi:hypothetical protein